MLNYDYVLAMQSYPIQSNPIQSVSPNKSIYKCNAVHYQPSMKPGYPKSSSFA